MVRYRWFINVPLAVRYQITKNKFSYYTYAGLAINFLIREQAKMNIDNSQTTITNNIYGLKKSNFGYLFGVGLQCNLDNSVGIFMEPNLKGSITAMTENIAVKCYPYSFGLNAGISFHF